MATDTPETEIDLLPNDGDVLNRKRVATGSATDSDDGDVGEEEGSSSPDSRPFEYDFRYFASDVILDDLERRLRHDVPATTTGDDEVLAVDEDESVFEQSAGVDTQGAVVRRWSRRRRNHQHHHRLRARPHSSSAFSDLFVSGEDEALTTRFDRACCIRRSESLRLEPSSSSSTSPPGRRSSSRLTGRPSSAGGGRESSRTAADDDGYDTASKSTTTTESGGGGGGGSSDCGSLSTGHEGAGTVGCSSCTAGGLSSSDDAEDFEVTSWPLSSSLLSESSSGLNSHAREPEVVEEDGGLPSVDRLHVADHVADMEDPGGGGVDDIEEDDGGYLDTTSSALMNWDYLEEQLQRAIEREKQVISSLTRNQALCEASLIQLNIKLLL